MRKGCGSKWLDIKFKAKMILELQAPFYELLVSNMTWVSDQRIITKQLGMAPTWTPWTWGSRSRRTSSRKVISSVTTLMQVSCSWPWARSRWISFSGQFSEDSAGEERIIKSDIRRKAKNFKKKCLARISSLTVRWRASTGNTTRWMSRLERLRSTHYHFSLVKLINIIEDKV